MVKDSQHAYRNGYRRWPAYGQEDEIAWNLPGQSAERFQLPPDREYRAEYDEGFRQAMEDASAVEWGLLQNSLKAGGELTERTFSSRWRGRTMTQVKARARVTVVTLMILLAGCSQPLSTREKGTLLGGGIGAASGAIIGSAVGHPGAGAAIGGAMGALSGGLIGDQLQGQEHRAAYQQHQINRQNREIQRQRRDIQQLKRRSNSDDEEY